MRGSDFVAVHFILPDSAYREAVISLVNPVRRWMSKTTIGNKPRDGCLNVCYFKYTEKMNSPESIPSPKVLTSHGIADKNYIKGITEIESEEYDYILVSGERLKGELVEDEKCEEGNVYVGGWPKLDYIIEGKYGQYVPRRKNKRVLWAPTHNAIQQVSTYPAFEHYLQRFPEELEIISSVHPSRKENKKPTMKELVTADVVIADAGSTIYEAWLLGKPVIFPDWLVKDGVMNIFKGTAEFDIYDQGLGYHARSFDEIVDMIVHETLEVEEPEQKFIDEIHPPELLGISGKRTAEILEEIHEKEFGAKN